MLVEGQRSEDLLRERTTSLLVSRARHRQWGMVEEMIKEGVCIEELTHRGQGSVGAMPFQEAMAGKREDIALVLLDMMNGSTLGFSESEVGEGARENVLLDAVLTECFTVAEKIVEKTGLQLEGALRNQKRLRGISPHAMAWLLEKQVPANGNLIRFTCSRTDPDAVEVMELILAHCHDKKLLGDGLCTAISTWRSPLIFVIMDACPEAVTYQGSASQPSVITTAARSVSSESLKVEAFLDIVARAPTAFLEHCEADGGNPLHAAVHSGLPGTAIEKLANQLPPHFKALRDNRGLTADDAAKQRHGNTMPFLAPTPAKRAC